MNKGKMRTVILGLVFLSLLAFAYLENTSFFAYIQSSFITNPLLTVLLLFIHNTLVVSLIVLGMTLYVGIVLNFMSKRQIEQVIIQNPSIFAVVFTTMILLISILRASTLISGQIDIEKLVLVILISVPNASVEGYGIFYAIKNTLARKLTIRNLGLIYLIFFLAAIVEVSFIQLLPLISARATLQLLCLFHYLEASAHGCFA